MFLKFTNSFMVPIPHFHNLLLNQPVQLLGYNIYYTKIVQKKHKKTCVSFYCEILCIFVLKLKLTV